MIECDVTLILSDIAELHQRNATRGVRENCRTGYLRRVLPASPAAWYRHGQQTA